MQCVRDPQLVRDRHNKEDLKPIVLVRVVDCNSASAGARYVGRNGREELIEATTMSIQGASVLMAKSLAFIEGIRAAIRRN